MTHLLINNTLIQDAHLALKLLQTLADCYQSKIAAISMAQTGVAIVPYTQRRIAPRPQPTATHTLWARVPNARRDAVHVRDWLDDIHAGVDTPSAQSTDDALILQSFLTADTDLEAAAQAKLALDAIKAEPDILEIQPIPSE